GVQAHLRRHRHSTAAVVVAGGQHALDVLDGRGPYPSNLHPFARLGVGDLTVLRRRAELVDHCCLHVLTFPWCVRPAVTALRILFLWKPYRAEAMLARLFL